MRTTKRNVLVRARDSDELRDALLAMKTEVPLRTEGRTSEHVEGYSVVHLLLSVPLDRFWFPLTVDHGDRPDFLVIEEAGRRVAIEHVEAVPENEARKQALRERLDKDGMHFIGHAVPGEARKTNEELLREIEEDDAGDGWAGDMPEREWAEAMAFFAMRKSASVQKSGYDRGDSTQLLIYDNWPLPHVNAHRAAEYFIANEHHGAIFDQFDRVYVMNGAGVWEFTKDGYEHHTLVTPEADP